MPLLLNYLAALVILGAWGAFAWVGKTPVEPFIGALGVAFTAISGAHWYGLRKRGTPAPDQIANVGGVLAAETFQKLASVITAQLSNKPAA